MMVEESTIVRLMDIANAACHKGRPLEARTIFDSILVIKPGHVPALIGQALSHIVVDELGKAETMLRDILASHEGDADAQAMLGFCLILMKRTDEATALLEPLKNTEGSAGKLAQSLLLQA